IPRNAIVCHGSVFFCVFVDATGPVTAGRGVLACAMAFGFSLGARDPGSRARRGTLHTARGSIETPVFMPVGTRATVTGIEPAQLLALDAPILLANTYHLLLRP